MNTRGTQSVGRSVGRLLRACCDDESVLPVAAVARWSWRRRRRQPLVDACQRAERQVPAAARRGRSRPARRAESSSLGAAPHRAAPRRTPNAHNSQ